MADGTVGRMVGLKDWFAELPDPRSSINQRHSLVDVVEHANRTRDRHVAENLAWLRRFTLRLLKQHPSKSIALS